MESTPSLWRHIQIKSIYIDNDEPNLQQDVLIESSLIENNEQDVAETEEDTLFLDDSVSLENDVIKTDDNKSEDKMYLKVAAGKILFSDVDLSEPQIILAQDIVVLGLFLETYYSVQYADSEGVKSAYSGAIYPAELYADPARTGILPAGALFHSLKRGIRQDSGRIHMI